MSLHIGNLSSRTRIDDLEHVFRRFGRCTIQVKDKYGFVVYDYPASAERALKALSRQRICGEAITLSWSKRQPQALRRFSRGGKGYEPPHRKYSMKENVDRRLNLNDRRDYKKDSQQAAGQGRNLVSSDMVDESNSFHPDDSKGHLEERYRHSNEIAGVGKNHLEDSTENCLENGIEFDRYEPYHSDDKKESDEHQTILPMAGSPAATNMSQEKSGTGHNDHPETSDYPYNPESQRTCYACGEVGHKMRNCPFDLKKHKSRFPRRHQESDRELLASRNQRRLLRRGGSPHAHAVHMGKRKDFIDKKRNRRDYESQDKNHAKRAWVPSSSSRSYSTSRSFESLAQSQSHSKANTVTLRKNSPSSSRTSTSRHSGSKPFKSPSASRSMSPSFSALPGEFDRHFSTPPNRRQTDPNDSIVNAVGVAQSQHLFEAEKMVGSGEGASISENITAVVENECEAGSTKLEEEEKNKDLSEKDDGQRYSVPRVSGEVRVSDDNDQDIVFRQNVNETRDSQNEDLVREHVLAPGSDISLSSNISNSARMTLDEICMVLKHYGLQYPKETEKDLPVETYFGSARSWPWEIIYYRRLKKGPISAENYARRISQNEEFGIVEKYIRGSSGWCEQNEENL